MDLIPTYRIEIGEYVFKHVHEVRINHDRKTLADTCSIKMPVKYQSDKLNKIIKIGDVVKIWLAYDFEHNVTDDSQRKFPLFRTAPDFAGYVSAKQPGYPFEIICQDEMWMLKKKRVASKTFVKTPLKSILEYLVPDANIDVPKITPGQFIIDGSKTISKHLESIKKTFGFDIYFRNEKLFVGLPYTDKDTVGKSVTYHLQKNVVNNSLRFVSKEDIIMRIKAVTTLPDGTKKEYIVGDDAGKTQNMTIANISLEALKILADEKLNNTKHDGLKGNITAFGLPYVEHGWTVKIKDDWWNLEGNYFADAVTLVSGINGFRIITTLGRKAA
jgi:hypothetical protein